MKKLWIGTGITICIIIIGNIIAQKLVPDRALPISVFAACLCLSIPMLLIAVWICMCAIEEIKECNRKGKWDISGMIVQAIVILFFLATLVSTGIRGVKAMKDIVNGPIEQPVCFSYIKKTKSLGYRTRRTNYYLMCRTDDDKSERLKIRVNESKLKEVYAVRWEAQSKYGFLEDKYIVCYFENLKILHELKMVEPLVDTDETD